MTDSAGQVAASRTPGAEPLTRSHFLIESLPLKPAEEKRKIAQSSSAGPN